MRRALAVVVLLFSFSAHAAVTLTLGPIEHPPTAKVLVATATLMNDTDDDLTNVVVFGRLGHSVLAGQSDATWSCRDAGTLQTVRCTASLIRARTTTPVTFYIDALVGRFTLTVHATWHRDVYDEGAGFEEQHAVFPHDIHVTHDGDAGEGSLRRAIVLANEDCEGLKLPCRIVFAEPMTIRPLTPLPQIWGMDIAVDGGGRVTLDGSLVSGGSGLELVESGWYGVVRGLTIRNFPWDGINISRAARVVVEDCTIEANGSRGVTGEPRSQISVLRSRIRSNGRSGVFALGGSTVVEESAIEGNGASGVFFTGGLSRVHRSRIVRNAHFGIAVPRSVGALKITENSIAGNAIAGIDRGLDGFDGDRYDDYATHFAYIPPPRLTQARYDATSNTTTIRGTYFGADSWGTWSVEVFSNEKDEAQGETFLGRTTAAGDQFVLAVPGDLRGRFITATGFRYLNLGWSGDWWWTTEFAETIEVQ